VDQHVTAARLAEDPLRRRPHLLIVGEVHGKVTRSVLSARDPAEHHVMGAIAAAAPAGPYPAITTSGISSAPFQHPDDGRVVQLGEYAVSPARQLRRGPSAYGRLTIGCAHTPAR
jgi:type IV secretory pathway ATPase VirB11/archaellum biosynthesis ATPase